MGRYLVTVEVDTAEWEREQGEGLTLKDVRDYASTLGAEPGAQWDDPPATRIVSVAEEDHLDFVNVVEVDDGRENPTYLFGRQDQAKRFHSVAMHSWEEHQPVEIRETPINVGAPAERLIASERGDVLEGMGYEKAAGDLRAGSTVASLLDTLKAAQPVGAKIGDDVLSLLQRWAEEDAKGGEPR